LGLAGFVCYVRSLLPVDRVHDLLKTLDTCFKVFDDLFSQHIRIGEVVQICRAFVSDPEDVQTGFVTGHDVFIGKFAPSAVGIVFRPGFLPFVTVFRLVASYEILQIVIGHWVFLFREMDIGPEVIKPDLFCPGVFAGRFVLEKNDVCLDPLRIKYAGWKPENGMHVGILKEFLSNRFTGPAFKQHIVRNNHGRLAGGFEHGANNLDKRCKPFGSELIRCLWQAIHNDSTS